MTPTKPLLVLALLLATGHSAYAHDPVKRFQEAVATEEEEGDLNAALAAYRAFADDESSPLGLRAKALLRVATCLEKLGKQEEALAAYQRAVTECSSFEAIARAARAGSRRTKRVAQAEANAKAFTVTSTDGAISLEAEDAKVGAVLLEIGRKGGVSVVVSPDVRGNVAMDFVRLSPLDALTLIAETTGDYEVIWSAAHRIARIQTRSAGEMQLSTRVFRLRRRSVTWELGQARAALYRNVLSMVVASQINGASAQYDVASGCLVVRTTRRGLLDVERVLGGELVAAPAPLTPEGPQPGAVTLDGGPSDLVGVLGAIATQAELPLVLSPEVRGHADQVYLEGVPGRIALREVALASGDFEVIERPVGMLVCTRASTEQWIELHAWKLDASPVDLYRNGGFLLAKDGTGRLPVPPIYWVLNNMVASTQIMGASVEFDSFSNTFLCAAPPGLAAELRTVLEEAGYLDKRAATAFAGERVRIGLLGNVRTVFRRFAKARGFNLIVSPDVRGAISGDYPKDGELRHVLELLAHGVGDFEVFERPVGTWRVTTRSALETQLVTTKLSLKTRPSVSPDSHSLYWAVNNLVSVSAVQGALCAYNEDGNYLVVTAPPPAVAAFQRILPIVDTLGVPAALAGEYLFVEGDSTLVAEVQLYTVGASGPVKISTPLSLEKARTVQISIKDDVSVEVLPGRRGIVLSRGEEPPRTLFSTRRYAH
jgi:hypothetical protein